MEIITVHEHKFLLILSILCTAFFGACWFFSALSGYRHNDASTILICSLIFGGFTVLGIFLLTDFYRRKLILFSSCLKYVPAIGRSRTFYYNDIERIVVKNEQFIMYSHEGKRLASLELNMPGCLNAIFYLQEREVPFRDKKLSSPSRPSSFFTWLGRRSKYDPHVDYITSKWSTSKIFHEKKVIRILGILTVILSIVPFIFSIKWVLFTQLLILLFYYCLYLGMFPKLTLTTAKECDEYHIPFPVFSCAASAFILLLFIDRINISFHIWMFFSLAFSIILLIPYIIMLCLKKIKEHPVRLILATCFFFFISMTTCHAVNYITAFAPPTHDTVIVTQKHDSYSSNSGTSYYFQFTWRDKEQDMGVSKSLYESTDVGDTVKVCNRKSIFGVEFQILHE